MPRHNQLPVTDARTLLAAACWLATACGAADDAPAVDTETSSSDGAGTTDPGLDTDGSDASSGGNPGLDSTDDTGGAVDTDTGDSGSSTGPVDLCGNGELDDGELCDDGNSDTTDACVACAPATCGDGYTWPNTEQCDDGNRTDYDGCDANCTPTTNFVFVTSTEQMPGGLGGLEGADTLCNDLAGEAGLPGDFVAWLATDQAGPTARLEGARGWKRVDGRLVADQAEQLLTGVWHPPRLDEFGETAVLGDMVFTGTAPGGMPFASTCDDWTSTVAPNTNAGQPDGGLSFWFNTNQHNCNLPGHIYCFGTDYNDPLPLLPAQGRTAFTTDAYFSSGGGIESADALCQQEADEHKLDGTYRALLAQQGASAISRFDTNGPTWVRVDGVPLVDQAEDLATPDWNAPLVVTVDGAHLARAVWTGAQTPDTPGDAMTCDDWVSVSPEQEMTHGVNVRTSALLFDSGTGGCHYSDLRLYCLEA